MFRGFYTLTSNMITQERRLNVISNNMANVATPGFKSDELMTATFQEMLAHRTGSVDKSSPAYLGANVHMMRVVDERVTNFEQGAFDFTERPLDVAIIGEGFFEIQTPQGDPVYTRNGSFTLDDEGYLFLQHIGRVIGDNGEPILLQTDKIEFQTDGAIVFEGGGILGRLRIADFIDYELLEKTGEGMFLNPEAGNAVEVGFPTVRGKMLERSNVNAMDEMVAMMTSQRSLQAASQIVKTYDQLMAAAANDIGRI